MFKFFITSLFYFIVNSVFFNFDVKSQLEHQIQIQETKETGWIFDKLNSKKIKFYKTGELIGSSYFKSF